jgi:large subunit ribosomal protein L17
MRHRVNKRYFGRSTKHRQATLRNLLRQLFMHGKIETSQAKAKEIKRWADKLITEAKKDDLESKRELHRFFGKRDIVNTLTQQIAPVMDDRNSGYTTLSVLGKRRGDNTVMARLELVKKPENLGQLTKPESK